MKSTSQNAHSLRWAARLYSILTGGLFLLILFLAVTNEDKPQGLAIPILILLICTILANFAAWRWEKVGGAIVACCALGLGMLSFASSLSLGLNAFSVVPALIYSVPFLIVGILFWVSASGADRRLP